MCIILMFSRFHTLGRGQTLVTSPATSEAGTDVPQSALLVSDLRPWDPECSDTDSDIYKRHNISIHHRCHVRSGSELRGSFSEFTQRWPRRDQPGAGQLGGGSGSVIVKYLYQPKSLNLGARSHYLGPTCVLHIKYLYMQQGQSRLQKEINLFGVNTATRIRERLSWHQSLTFPRNALTAASLTQLVFCRK